MAFEADADEVEGVGGGASKSLDEKSVTEDFRRLVGRGDGSRSVGDDAAWTGTEEDGGGGCENEEEWE